jgi:hypothetical protein
VTHLTMRGDDLRHLTSGNIGVGTQHPYSVSDTKLGHGWILMQIIPIGRLLLLGGGNTIAPRSLRLKGIYSLPSARGEAKISSIRKRSHKESPPSARFATDL